MISQQWDISISLLKFLFVLSDTSNYLLPTFYIHWIFSTEFFYLSILYCDSIVQKYTVILTKFDQIQHFLNFCCYFFVWCLQLIYISSGHHNIWLLLINIYLILLLGQQVDLLQLLELFSEISEMFIQLLRFSHFFLVLFAGLDLFEINIEKVHLPVYNNLPNFINLLILNHQYSIFPYFYYFSINILSDHIKIFHDEMIIGPCCCGYPYAGGCPYTGCP